VPRVFDHAISAASTSSASSLRKSGPCSRSSWPGAARSAAQEPTSSRSCPWRILVRGAVVFLDVRRCRAGAAIHPRSRRSCSACELNGRNGVRRRPSASRPRGARTVEPVRGPVPRSVFRLVGGGATGPVREVLVRGAAGRHALRKSARKRASRFARRPCRMRARLRRGAPGRPR